MTQEDLEQLGKLIDAKLESINNRLGSVEKNMATKSDLKNGLESLKTEVKQEIRASQADTIKALTEVIDEAHTLYEERFTQIEEALDISRPKKN